ncbi:MAG: phosphoribosylamine--glycine ligase [Armatimonadota bacterium]|nr:phosphoribosylamine--glycine ligase [Armatimonadota bacterium]
MRVLVVGSGAREHALVWKLANSATVDEVFSVPGNPGIEQLAEVLPVDVYDFFALNDAAMERRIDLVVIGPEKPLCAGIADFMGQTGIPVFGPSETCAQIEGSKAFAKQLMVDAGIPTARHSAFSSAPEARAYIHKEWSEGRQVVVKASGEALGKGAVLPETVEEATNAADGMLVRNELGEAGRTIVVEERLTGRELSLMAVCNGRDFRLLPPARDHKKVGDGDTGRNTGGMGAVSPIDVPNLDELGEMFVRPVLDRFLRDGTPYVGALYPGLMLTDSGPKCLEYNCRFGDPEAQCVLPRVGGDFAQVLLKAARGEDLPKPIVSVECSVSVVMTSKGYPGNFEKLAPLPDLHSDDVLVFHAGVSDLNGSLVSSGGRVLTVTALGTSVAEAREKAYAFAMRFDNGPWHYRRDIGAF